MTCIGCAPHPYMQGARIGATDCRRAAYTAIDAACSTVAPGAAHCITR